jgi:hypothetical protein
LIELLQQAKLNAPRAPVNGRMPKIDRSARQRQVAPSKAEPGCAMRFPAGLAPGRPGSRPASAF